MQLVLGLGLGGSMALSGCLAETVNPACVGSDPEVVELDDDLGGYSVSGVANARSGQGVLTDNEGVEVGFTMETVVIGPAVAVWGATCSNRASFEAPAEVTLRSDDGRVDVVLSGELSYDEVANAGLIEVDDVDADAVPGVVDLPADLGATSVVHGLTFNLSGTNGMGTIELRRSGLSTTLTVAELALPYAVAEGAFAP